MARTPVHVGIVARTGSAVAVALAGTAQRPAFAGRWAIELVTDDLPRQPYHVAAGLEAAEAAEIVRQVERAAAEAAATALHSIRSAAPVAAVGLLIKPGPAARATVAEVVRSHVAMHSAEGELYRDALMSAAETLGLPVHAIPPDALPEAAEQVRMLGDAAGRPWRREEKDAARCAMVLLRWTGSTSPDSDRSSRVDRRDR